MDILLAPDIFVNASVAPGEAPDQVVQRVLGKHKGESKTTPWVLERVEAMLSAVPAFKKDAIKPHVELIKSFVNLIEEKDTHPPGEWEKALICAARAAAAKRVVTDHPDLLAKETIDGIDFISSEAWLLEQQMPPPPPPSKAPPKDAAKIEAKAEEKAEEKTEEKKEG